MSICAHIIQCAVKVSTVVFNVPLKTLLGKRVYFYTKMYIMVYMATPTNTATILNIKTDKKLKAEAKAVADSMGLTLTTVVNSMLKQFVLEKEITFSAKIYEPSPYLIKALQAADDEYKLGKVKRYSSVEAMRADLMKE